MTSRVLTVRFSAAMVLFAAAFLGAPASPAFADTWRIVDVRPDGRVHLRERATSRSRVLAYVPGDARSLKGLDCAGSWCRIEFRGITGWIYKRYLAPDDGSPRIASSALDLESDMTALSEAKRLHVFNPAGQPVPVYAFPSDTLPIAGRLNDGVDSVEGLGACVKGWCYIRSGPLIGWLPALILAPADEGGESTASIAATLGKPEAQKDDALNATTTTAITAAIAPAPGASDLPAGGGKFYKLAGLGGAQSLPLHEAADDKSPVLARIARNETRIEGLRQCAGKWCRVRWNGREGWVERRHLADPAVETSQIFKVTGLPLWQPLDVVDRPGTGAGVVGEIPSYATGIVPIGGCDETWCHVRYLGVAGWVDGRHLKPQPR